MSDYSKDKCFEYLMSHSADIFNICKGETGCNYICIFHRKGDFIIYCG